MRKTSTLIWTKNTASWIIFSHRRRREESVTWVFFCSRPLRYHGEIPEGLRQGDGVLPDPAQLSGLELQDAKAKVELLDQYQIPVWVMEPLRGGALTKAL